MHRSARAKPGKRDRCRHQRDRGRPARPESLRGWVLHFQLGKNMTQIQVRGELGLVTAQFDDVALASREPREGPIANRLGVRQEGTHLIDMRDARGFKQRKLHGIRDNAGSSRYRRRTCQSCPAAMEPKHATGVTDSGPADPHAVSVMALCRPACLRNSRASPSWNRSNANCSSNFCKTRLTGYG